MWNRELGIVFAAAGAKRQRGRNTAAHILEAHIIR